MVASEVASEAVGLMRKGDTITVSANAEVWRAVRDALRQSASADPFYHALISEVESALEDWLDEQFEAEGDWLGEGLEEVE